MRCHDGFRYRPAKALRVELLNTPPIAPELDSKPDLPMIPLSTHPPFLRSALKNS